AQRFVACGDGHRHDPRHVLHVLRDDPSRWIEFAVHFPGHAAGERRSVELRDRADAAAARCERVEVAFAADAVRAERANASNHDTRFAHGCSKRVVTRKHCNLLLGDRVAVCGGEEMRMLSSMLLILCATATAVLGQPSADDIARRTVDNLAGPQWDAARYIAFTFDVEAGGKQVASWAQRWD